MVRVLRLVFLLADVFTVAHVETVPQPVSTWFQKVFLCLTGRLKM